MKRFFVLVHMLYELFDTAFIMKYFFFLIAFSFVLKSYFDANEELLDRRKARELFHEEWTVYTRTNDSCPTQYFEGSNVKSSVISNGCLIEGTVENSIIGRGCEIRKGAVVRNCVVNADVVIGKDVHVENMVIDKHAKLIHSNQIIAEPEKPGYIRRGDKL